ncbi:bifunctional diaminohydroxyphosphoribosylaminopyrimidine deaminase/5-amino-6-(5-phosphoribosylamino)uracil reductase RibD [Limimaricola variabilis]|uniref:bifunctional diaminohydroxyphosphoribosylaminopyrimidine deaminase/5-amino-6-(5-phosphoribosylamino)uracil reductase RibD n=1 Tax=Limimaricola variabilis TaxID=1492771 RepID=UPI002AC96CD2|nr:bifunctional diaminohydroxyphosphoribosylaminopyrimidine deaminase/5-amino-6-(5-phosphoribosylamino)uracil reductase RibD [Limimaricola variabilis]WPY93088.1 bifunctional diaminohydroxyphosphoribosylaminopyrimidine deaminase/5-amino-6-(5-phosphoribosylamino)uracil reductase RibD [Limimaricola variabilis]
MNGSTDRRFMALALSLGRRGLGRVWPNPNVGCVIVRDGRIVGRGRTADDGRPHAETQALAQAGDAARGATAYVTLEPCAHHGRTPPCAEALVAAGVARVVVAAQDPDPRVAGRGLERLRAAGIVVETGLMEAQARRDMAGFLSRVERGRPFVTLKLATSLDGRIATGSGESRWITGPAARARVHMMRARHDAVMVGGGTARADDPMLDVRGLGIDRQPVRVVLSRRLDLPIDGRLARTAGTVPLWLCHEEGADTAPWQAVGARSLPCKLASGQIDPAAALGALAEAGLTRVFCEGGAGLAASLLGAGLVDELVLFTAGLAIGAEGTPALSAMGIDALAKAPRLTLVTQERVGVDVMSVWRPAKGAEGDHPG